MGGGFSCAGAPAKHQTPMKDVQEVTKVGSGWACPLPCPATTALPATPMPCSHPHPAWPPPAAGAHAGLWPHARQRRRRRRAHVGAGG